MAEPPLAGRPLAGPRYRMRDGSAVCETPGFDDLVTLSGQSGLPLRWMVVDDLVDTLSERKPGGVCELAISPWPQLNESGRLSFARDEDEHRVAAYPTVELSQLVRESRARLYRDVPGAAELIERPLRVGDAFAALVEVDDAQERPVGGEVAAVAFPHGADGILDVTADARMFARVQAALADVRPLAGRQLDLLGEGLELRQREEGR